jgi:hypothetical protein
VEAALLLSLLGGSLLAAVPPQASDQFGPGYDILMSRMIPMRDGVELEAWIFKPSHLTTKAPAVLEPIPNTTSMADVIATSKSSRVAVMCLCRSMCMAEAVQAASRATISACRSAANR